MKRNPKNSIYTMDDGKDLSTTDILEILCATDFGTQKYDKIFQISEGLFRIRVVGKEYPEVILNFIHRDDDDLKNVTFQASVTCVKDVAGSYLQDSMVLDRFIQKFV